MSWVSLCRGLCCKELKHLLLPTIWVKQILQSLQMTAAQANNLTAISRETLSQNYSGKQLPDSWPSEQTKKQTICYFMLWSLGAICYATIDTNAFTQASNLNSSFSDPQKSFLIKPGQRYNANYSTLIYSCIFRLPLKAWLLKKLQPPIIKQWLCARYIKAIYTYYFNVFSLDLWGRYYYPHLTNEDPETWRHLVKSHT